MLQWAVGKAGIEPAAAALKVQASVHGAHATPGELSRRPSEFFFRYMLYIKILMHSSLSNFSMFII